jgi:hypothetical protein
VDETHKTKTTKDQDLDVPSMINTSQVLIHDNRKLPPISGTSPSMIDHQYQQSPKAYGSTYTHKPRSTGDKAAENFDTGNFNRLSGRSSC